MLRPIFVGCHENIRRARVPVAIPVHRYAR